MSNYYASMLADLIRRRDALATELSGVNTAISAIMPLVQGEGRPDAGESQPPIAGSSATRTVIGKAMVFYGGGSPQPSPNRYAKISVRWAALWHLAEFAPGPMRNMEIANAIREGGYRSGAGSFPNAVSAVLSGMRARGEIDGNPDTGYYITELGRHTWGLIKQGAKFRETTSSPSEQTLLSVQ